MIDREHDLPVTKQTKILRISRGSVYYRARPVSATDLEVMRRLDRLHLEFPFAGSRMLQGLLSADGCKIGRRHVKTLMRRMAATSIVMVPAGGVETGDVTVRAIVSWTSVNPLLTTFPGSHCCNPANSALSLGRIDQECAMSRPGEIAGDKLRAIVERIERIEEEIKELVEGKKEIYFEAKGNGFDVKILREVIRVRKQDQKQREEQESLLDLYLRAVKGAARAAKAA